MRYLIVVLMMFASLAMHAAEISLPFDICKNRNALLVLVKVNGKAARLLLDTGAEYTVLSSAFVGVSAVDLREAAFRRAPGMEGEAVWSTADLRLANMRLEQHSVVLMNLDQVKGIYGKEVDGLLGQDVLSGFASVTIDFKNHHLILTK
jgi:predicted aspartyl protease